MRPKLVVALLAVGTFVLIGGGVFAATRPTWHPAMSAGVKATKRVAAGAGAAATAQAAHPAASSAATGRHAITATRAAKTTHARAGSRHGASSAGRSHAAKALQHSAAKPAITYTVKPGDTLSGIAAWFKLHGYGSLYAANRSVIGSSPDLIFPGERITINHGGVMTLRAAHKDASAS